MKKIVLKNGVTVVIEEMTGIRSVAFGFFVKNGSRNELLKENGISHFIEHMLFKGTKNRTATEIATEIDMAGGQLNAYTTKEYTCYYTRVLDESFEKAFEILSDMYFNSLFDDEEIKKELSVIIEEINMYEDTPDDLVYEQLQLEIWKNNSLGRAILGTKESIARFTHNDFLNYMEEHYTPENTVISVAGNVSVEKVTEVVEKYFSHWENKRKMPLIEAPIYVPCNILREKDIEQEHICISYPGLSNTDDDFLTLSVLNTVVGGGMSSILFQKIREEMGLAYTVYSYNSGFFDTGLFTVYMGLNPENGKRAVETVRQELNELKNGNFSQEMVEKSKLQLKNNYLLSLESTSSVMSNMGRSQLLKNNVLTTEQLINKVDLITKERVTALAKRIFDTEKESISIVTKKTI